MPLVPLRPRFLLKNEAKIRKINSLALESLFYFSSPEFLKFSGICPPFTLACGAAIIAVFHLKTVDLAVWAEAAAVEPVAVGVEVVFDKILRDLYAIF